jgi:hypothetical protein
MANIIAESDITQKADGGDAAKEAVLTKLNDWLLEGERSTSETLWREESEEDYKFYAGDQDSAEVIASLEAQKRPISVYNEIKPKVDMLIGIAAQARQTPILVPVGTEDEALTEVMNGVLIYYRQKTKTARKEMDAFAHTVKGGRSFIHTYMGGDNPFQPELQVVRIPGRDVVVDPDSIEYDLSDAKYVFISKWFDAEEIKGMYPDYDANAVKVFSQQYVGVKPTYFNEANHKYRLVEGWYREFVPIYWFKNPLTGKSDSLKEDEFVKFEKAVQEGIPLPDGKTFQSDEPIKAIKRMGKRVKYAIFSGSMLLEEGPSPYKHNELPIVLFGAYKNEDENRWFGAITMAKDPQRALNTTRRQLVHLLQVSPKGILVYETGTIVNIEEYQEKSSEPNFALEVTRGGIDKHKFTSQPQISVIYGQLDELFSQSIKDVVGTQDALMGIQTSSREPGVTLQKRQETGIAVLYTMFENFRESRIALAKQMVSLIQQYETTERILRIEGPEGAQLLQINSQTNPQSAGFNDVSFGEFDARIDESVENVTMKAFALTMLSQFGANNPNTIPPDLLMEYSSLPYSAKQRVRAFNQQQMEREDQKFAAEMQLKVRELDIKEKAAENKPAAPATIKKSK